MSKRNYMKCEWCTQSAGYRVKSRVRGKVYQRFACDDERHQEKTRRLALIDIGRDAGEVLYNPTGFSAETGRALGPG